MPSFCITAQDANRARVTELRKCVGGITTVRGLHKRRKTLLIDLLRKTQAARVILRSYRVRRHHAKAALIQRWWKYHRRMVANNKRDPITMNMPSEAESILFRLVNASGVVHVYESDSLYEYFVRSMDYVEPICRQKLNRIELRRLERCVSSSTLQRLGSLYSASQSETWSLRTRDHAQSEDISDFFSNELTDLVNHTLSVATLHGVHSIETGGVIHGALVPTVAEFLIVNPLALRDSLLRQIKDLTHEQMPTRIIEVDDQTEYEVPKDAILYMVACLRNLIPSFRPWGSSDVETPPTR